MKELIKVNLQTGMQSIHTHQTYGSCGLRPILPKQENNSLKQGRTSLSISNCLIAFVVAVGPFALFLQSQLKFLELQKLQLCSTKVAASCTPVPWCAAPLFFIQRQLLCSCCSSPHFVVILVSLT